MWSYYFSTFTKIFRGPEGLEIGVVEALLLLLGIGEIERGARPDMVDVPLAVVIPMHPRLELALKVEH